MDIVRARRAALREFKASMVTFRLQAALRMGVGAQGRGMDFNSWRIRSRKE